MKQQLIIVDFASIENGRTLSSHSFTLLLSTEVFIPFQKKYGEKKLVLECLSLFGPKN